MMLSEEQAKTKRCQETFAAAQSISPNGHSYSGATVSGSYTVMSYAIHTAPMMCIGSGCMAWRWHDGAPEPGEHETSCRGYCGKAGRPSP